MWIGFLDVSEVVFKIVFNNSATSVAAAATSTGFAKLLED
jgi:hypothetical protein